MNALAIANGAMEDARQYANNRIALETPISRYAIDSRKVRKILGLVRGFSNLPFTNVPG